jgi:hypothetical protein
VIASGLSQCIVIRFSAPCPQIRLPPAFAVCMPPFVACVAEILKVYWECFAISGSSISNVLGESPMVEESFLIPGLSKFL